MPQNLTNLIDSVDDLVYEDREKILNKCLELKLNIQESADGSRINLNKLPADKLKILTEYIQSLINAVKEKADQCQ